MNLDALDVRGVDGELAGRVLLLTVIAGASLALVSTGRADVPVLPVYQDIDRLQIVMGDLSEANCRECHDSGVLDRHHLLAGLPIPPRSLVPHPDADGEGNPDTVYGCLTCHDQNITVVRDCLTCHGGSSPGPGPPHIVSEILHLVGTFDQRIDVVAAELNPMGSREDPVQKALDKSRKGLAAVEKKAVKEEAPRAFLAFARVVKGLLKSPQDIVGRFSGPFDELEDLIERDAGAAMDAIDEARRVIQNLGAPLPAKLDTKYQGAIAVHQSLLAMSATGLEYYKILRRVKFPKIQKSYEKAAARAQKRSGGG